jgi:hypothetical protein
MRERVFLVNNSAISPKKKIRKFVITPTNVFPPPNEDVWIGESSDVLPENVWDKMYYSKYNSGILRTLTGKCIFFFHTSFLSNYILSFNGVKKYVSPGWGMITIVPKSMINNDSLHFISNNIHQQLEVNNEELFWGSLSVVKGRGTDRLHSVKNDVIGSSI